MNTPRSNGAAPQPNKSCRGRLGLEGLRSDGVETVTGVPVRCMNRLQRLVGLLAARQIGAGHDVTAHCG